jgi:hypothetical protein
MTHGTGRLIAFVFATAWPAFVGASGEIPCRTESLPVSIPEGKPIVSVRKASFVSSSHLRGSMVLRNSGDKPIEALTIVAEYYDLAHKPLATLPYNAALKGTEDAYPAATFPYYRQRLNQPIPPGQDIYIAGFSDFAAESCPHSGQLMLIAARYSDGTSDRQTTSHWGLSARISDAPQYAEWPAGAPPPRAIRLRVKVGGDGRVEQVVGNNKTPAPDIERLSREIQKWTFLPALEDGRAMPSEMPMLVRFHPRPKRGFCSVQPGDAPIPTIVIDLVPGRPGNDEWQVFAGCRQISTVLPYAR